LLRSEVCELRKIIEAARQVMGRKSRRVFNHEGGCPSRSHDSGVERECPERAVLRSEATPFQPHPRHGTREQDTIVPKTDIPLQQRKAQQDAPACIVCTDTIVHTALGHCNHAAVCAFCCLKLRLKYNNFKCPVCNAHQAIVSLLPWQEHLPVEPRCLVDDFKLKRDLRRHHYPAKWARGVFIFKTESCALPSAETRPFLLPCT
jgi:hypothetical protein